MRRDAVLTIDVKFSLPEREVNEADVSDEEALEKFTNLQLVS